jgi:hypothetical protein
MKLSPQILKFMFELGKRNLKAHVTVCSSFCTFLHTFAHFHSIFAHFKPQPANNPASAAKSQLKVNWSKIQFGVLLFF